MMRYYIGNAAENLRNLPAQQKKTQPADENAQRIALMRALAWRLRNASPLRRVVWHQLGLAHAATPHTEAAATLHTVALPDTA